MLSKAEQGPNLIHIRPNSTRLNAAPSNSAIDPSWSRFGWVNDSEIIPLISKLFHKALRTFWNCHNLGYTTLNDVKLRSLARRHTEDSKNMKEIWYPRSSGMATTQESRLPNFWDSILERLPYPVVCLIQGPWISDLNA